MKKVVISILACMGLLTAYAGPISQQQALAVAKRYIAEKQVLTRAWEPVDLELAFVCHAGDRLDGTQVVKATGGAAAPLYYVFNKGEEQGFVMVAADDRMKAVLADAQEGDFDLKKVSPGLRWWLQAMQRKAELVVTNAVTEKTVQEEPILPYMLTEDVAIKPEVAPMVKTKWGQGAPYNLLCPVDNVDGNGEHSATGCVATAMAQVLNFWKYPQKPTGKVKYDMIILHDWTIEADLDTMTFHWDKMRDTYSDTGEEPMEEQLAVAELMYACGLAEHMNYCADYGSGTASNEMGLKRHMGMHATGVERDFIPKNEWMELMKRELSAGRPMMYSGSGLGGTHLFVCDGYNKEDLFHINWGWNGYLDGYFDLSELDSDNMDGAYYTQGYYKYSYAQGVLIGICPMEKYGEKVKQMMRMDGDMKLEKAELQDVQVWLEKLRPFEEPQTGMLRLAIKDEQGKQVGWMNEDVTLELKEDTFVCSPMVDHYWETLKIKGSWPKGLADGKYKLVPYYKLQGEEQYKPVLSMVSYRMRRWIELEQKNGVLTELNAVPEVKLEVSKLVLPDYEREGELLSLELGVKNLGERYEGVIGLYQVKNEDIGDIVYASAAYLEPQQEQAYDIAVRVPSGVDRDTLALVYFITPNNFKVLTAFDYKVEAKPLLKMVDMKLAKDGKLLPGDSLWTELTVTNEGGIYERGFWAFLDNATTWEAMAECKVDTILAGGETKTIRFDFELKEPLAPGKYAVSCYYKDPKEKYLQPIEGTDMRFEITSSTGVEQVVIATEVPEDAVIFTLQGVRMLQPWKLLPRGIYVVNGRKLMKQ